MATTNELAALRASFQQEVAVWQKLDHPNVTSVRTRYICMHIYMMPKSTFFSFSVLNYHKVDCSLLVLQWELQISRFLLKTQVMILLNFHQRLVVW